MIKTGTARAGTILGVAALVLSACSGTVDSAKQRGIQPAVNSSASPTPTYSTPKEYQTALTGLDARLAEAMRALSAHRSIKGLPEAIAELRASVQTERAELGGVAPPKTMADAHAKLDTALSDLSGALVTLASDAESGVVCTGDSAQRRLGDGDGAAAVRAAATPLAESDPAQSYRAGTFVPEPGKQLNRRGPNGELPGGRRGGRGRLTVTGNSEADATLKLKTETGVIRQVYVRNNEKVKIDGLPDGTYEVFVAQGKDWDSDSNRFTRDCSFSKLDDTLEFRTLTNQYTIWELELESWAGNVTSTQLDPEAFPE